MGYQTSFGSPGGKMGGNPSFAPGYQFWGNNQVGTGQNPMYAQGYGTTSGMPYGMMPPMRTMPPTGTQGLIGPPSLVQPPNLQRLPPGMPGAGFGYLGQSLTGQMPMGGGSMGYLNQPPPASGGSLGYVGQPSAPPQTAPTQNYYPPQGQWGSGH